MGRDPRAHSRAGGMKAQRDMALDARSVAADVLLAVWRRGALAAAELDDQLAARPTMERRERALCTELVYGVLRTHGALNERLNELAKRSIDDRLRVILWVGGYQLWFLDRIPPFAVVHQAVEQARRVGGNKPAGFVNALLRRLARERGRVNLAQAIRASVPGWLLEALEASVGAEQTQWLLGAVDGSENLAHVAPTGVRWVGEGPQPAWYQEAPSGVVYPSCKRLFRAGNLQATSEYQDGQFLVQEEGAAFAGAAVGARAGERVLDACAGSGQKSTLLAEALGPRGVLWATDCVGKKLQRLEREFQRLKLPPARTAVVDWTGAPPDGVPRDFQRILLDAPCTGTGTLRRRPEILLRLTPDDAERHAQNSEAMLRQLLAHLSPGGRLVFVVCSVLRRECEEVVERVSDLYEVAPFDAPYALLEDRSELRLLPGVHGTDGFFIASLKRR